MKKTVCTILILIFTGIFALGAFQIYRQLREYDEGTASYTDIVEQYGMHFFRYQKCLELMRVYNSKKSREILYSKW